jgi:lipopolysaccharide export system protein LptC
MPRPFLQLLLAITLVFAVSHFWRTGTSFKPDPETSAQRQGLPQTYLEHTSSWAYSKQGMLTQILEAASAEHFSHGDQTLMQEPRFYVHNGDNKTWSASAAKGRFRHRAEKLLLSQGVTLSHDQTGGHLETRAMVIDVKNKIATSKKPVTITQGPHFTRARGMVAHLEEETILLSPNVESTYVLPQS